MTIADVSSFGMIKLFFEILFKKERQQIPVEELMSMLNESGIKNIKISDRGGVEVSIDELKNSPQFQSLQVHASEKIRSNESKED